MNIFHFGCWNLFACHRGYVTNNIINNILQNHYDFGFISGDNIYNYYGKKASKSKVYSTKKMHDGIKCINQLDIPAFIAIGNHDIDDDNCAMIEIQMEPSRIPIIHNGWNMINNYYTVTSNNNVFIVIDTNILEINLLKNNEKIYKTFKCYEKIKHDPKHDPNMQLNQLIISDYNEMLNMVNNISFNQYHNIVMIGHIPIISIKEKRYDNELNCILNSTYLFIKLLDIFINKNVKKIYYVCADTHNFQHMIFNYKNLKIEQIVSGTGGALLDNIKECDVKITIPSIIKNITSFELLDYDSDFGYTSMNIDELTNNIKIKFIKFDYNINLDYYDEMEKSFN
jgi:hypothetical protein